MATAPLGNLPEVRAQLARLCRRKKCRVSTFSPSLPTHWSPTSVTDPEVDMPFTEVSAWEFVAQCLEAGHPLVEVKLRVPPGKKGYEMLVPLTEDKPPVYVKLQLGGSGKVIGRSFHYSER